MKRSVVFGGLLIVVGCAGLGTAWWKLSSRGTQVDSSSQQASRDPSTPRPKTRAAPVAPPDVPIQLVDVTKEAGIEFVHVDGHTDHEYIMETLGSGVAWIDYDQDGLLDLFLVQGHSFVPPHVLPSTCKLFRNLGGGKFLDVTKKVGLDHVGCGMGVAVGDIDNDGFPDLFLTCFGKPNVLYHNEPVDPGDPSKGRHFVDITAKAGMASHPDWQQRPNCSTSTTFLDYNQDGYLDLFVCSYVNVDLEHYPNCTSARSGKKFSCPPSMFESTRCILYRNNGNLTFTDVSHEAGIDVPKAKALGVVALDLNDDGKIDIFVANDGMPNFLFLNRGDGRFESVGPRCGCTIGEGATQAYMGVDADDAHGTGRPDLFATAFSQETNTLFRNLGKGHFEDATRGSGLGPPSWPLLGFGTCFLDLADAGALDIVVVNGHVSRFQDDEGDPAVTFRQKAQVFLNHGTGRFQDISSLAGPYFQQPHVGRGLAYADYDNDGHMDLAITNNGEGAYLLHNETKTPHHWIRLSLEGSRHVDPKGSNRDAVGAKVTLDVGGRKIVRHRKGGGSYLSSHDPRLLIGLGEAQAVDQIEIRWPNGAIQKFQGPFPADGSYRILEGKKETSSEGSTSTFRNPSKYR